MNSAILGAITPCAVIAAAPKSDPRGCKVADFVVKSAIVPGFVRRIRWVILSTNSSGSGRCQGYFMNRALGLFGIG